MVAELVTDNPWTLTFLLIALLCFWSSIPRRPSNVPPGPPPLPVIGNLIHFLSDPREKWRGLHKRYGDIYSLYMGHSLTVVLHTRDVIKEAFVDHADETSDRPDVFVLRKLGQNKDPTKIHQVLSNQNEIYAFIRSQISQHKRTLDREKPRDFIDAYLINFKEKQKRNPDTAFSEEQLTRVVSDLFVAGSETTASTLLWLVLYMVTYPDVQDKVHKELDDVVKMETQPLLHHRRMLPFLQAVICETQRYGDILPIGAPHAASKAFELQGYHIPQGAILLPFLHGVHFHPSWGDPDVFRPSRFLDGELHDREMLLPFSIGRRSCIGEHLAKTELFLFAAAILKRYRFTLPAGDSPPSLTAPIGHTVSPLAFRVCAHRRISEVVS
ncbi:cytochrome P450 2U1-like [Liolophura sinensis]|uniref:cytochrome P450 2U1-like n=1 Tax=Liolophura sinensis TaxID=3198878 RepID=UPI00315978C8